MVDKRYRFILLQVINPHFHQDLALEAMHELEQLVDTFGGEIVKKSIQHRVSPDPNTYIGEGKLAWLTDEVKRHAVDVVVMNAVVKTGQLFRIQRELWKVNRRIEVWDKVDLILQIFDQHARTAEAKLQIELARIKHIGPRVYGLGGTVLSRQGAGIGTRGLGETNIEREKRNIRKKVQQIEALLSKKAKEQQNKIEERKRLGLGSVALVGYTSAGKTTLFNTLTRKDKQTHFGLFTTLDSVLGKVKPSGSSKTILVSDTIGFIRDLPPMLIKAFRSTLMESIEAQVLLHVVDSADPHREEKMMVVDKILSELEVKTVPLLVFNKIDALKPDEIEQLKELHREMSPVFVSAKTGEGVDSLRALLRLTLDPGMKGE